jgi:hypothetical protein
MKNKNLIIISLLATVLMSGTLVSFVAAADDVSDATSAPDPTLPDSSDNSTAISGEDIIYTIQDNRTAINDTQMPDAESNPNLIATQTGAVSDNTLLIGAIAVALAVSIGGSIGVYHYRKQTAKAEN